jgi:hypothetical protein
MKIFGFDISFKRNVKDQVVVRTVTPSTTPISQIPSVKINTLTYAQQFARGRGYFMPPEYDLVEIGKIEDTDSFVRQAFKKKEGLMFKEGLGLKGRNKDTVRYVKTRMAQIARATGIPTIQLLKRTARSLIRTSNAYLIKQRDRKASGGRSRITPEGQTLPPVAGYFPAAPEMMRVDLDPETNEILGWQQILPDGRYKEFEPEDVIHFHIDRREGFFFGVPTLIPVIDDIRALRQIEENIELLLYQHLFPLFHYKVGTETAPAGYTEDGTKEVDAVEAQIRMMPSEGCLVTPERHEITAIGAEGRAIRAEGYLTHFKKRVFAGLGVSSVDMGDGDTTNRATANTLSRALVDAVKAIQDDLEAQWNSEVIAELLLESTFGQNVLEEDNTVYLEFHEIDVQNKMDQEKHAMEMFKANGLTWDEFRNALSHEPIPVPEDPEDQDPANYPEWHNTAWKLFDEPMALIKAVDEPYSAQAQAAAASRSTAVTPSQVGEAQQAQTAAEEKKAQIEKETKIAVAKAKPVIRRDSYLDNAFKSLEAETVKRIQNNIKSRGHIDTDYLLAQGRTWAIDTSKKINTLIFSEFLKGFNDQTGRQAAQAEGLIHLGRTAIQKRVDHYVYKLMDQTIRLIHKRVDEQVRDVRLSEAETDVLREAHTAFDATRYRTDFIWDVEERKAYTYGRLLGVRHLGGYGIQLVAHVDSCERCQAQHGRVVPVAHADLNDVPPFHPNSRMRFTVMYRDPNAVHDSVNDGNGSTGIQGPEPVVTDPSIKRDPKAGAIAQPEPSLSQKTAICPKCTYTATWQPKSGNFYCSKCKVAFVVEEDDMDVDDGAKLERCVKQVAAEQKKENPGMSEEDCKSHAFAICTAALKKKG